MVPNYGFVLSIILALILHTFRISYVNKDILSLTPINLAVGTGVHLACSKLNSHIGRPDWKIAGIILRDTIAPILSTQLLKPRINHHAYDCSFFWSYLCYELAPANQIRQLERVTFCHNRHGHSSQEARAHVRAAHANLPQYAVERKMAEICVAFETQVMNDAGQWSPEPELGLKPWSNALGRCLRGFRSDVGATWTDLTPIMNARQSGL